MHYLGIDLGTSGVKVVVCDKDSRVLFSESASLTVQSPYPLWSEQTPKDWWIALCQCMDQLAKQDALSHVAAIGLAGQMHGAVLLDESDNVLRPAILWNDGRCEAQCQQIMAQVPTSADITGNLVMPGFTAPKLLWVKQNEPEIFAQVRKVLLPKDYLRLLLSGEYASETSDAAGTSWLDTAKRSWSDTMLGVCGLNQSHMPVLFEGTAITGHLLPSLAARWGLGSIPIVGGAGDNAAGAVGVGIVDNGQGMISLGTSGVIFSVTDQYCANPQAALHSFCHAVNDSWHVMSVHLSAASCLQWFADTTANGNVQALLDELAQAEITNTNCYFLPYLSGERTPHNNPRLSGQFYGLGALTTRAEMTYAVLEGVAFAFKDGLNVISDANIDLSVLSVIGGGARSDYWRQLLCDVLQITLEYREGGEVGPALGAARLAMVGALASEPVANLCPPPALVKSHAPNPAKADGLNTRYSNYKLLCEHAITVANTLA